MVGEAYFRQGLRIFWKNMSFLESEVGKLMNRFIRKSMVRRMGKVLDSIVEIYFKVAAYE